MKLKILCGLCVSLFTVSIFAADVKEIKTDEQKFSYAVGFQAAQNIKRSGADVDIDVVTQAIKDVLENAPLKISIEEMRAAYESNQAKQAEKQQAKAEQNKMAGEDYLTKNKKKKGIVTLDNGLQYKVLIKGKGDKPMSADTVTVNYKGALINGEEFDSSYKRGTPMTFSVGGVIQGWQQILPMMETGAKWQVFIPSDLAYGPQGSPPNIGPNETLVFDIELISIKKSDVN